MEFFLFMILSRIMNPLPVTWQKNIQSNEWFDLLRLDMEASYFQGGKKGVFVIWCAMPSGGKALKVGSGNLYEQLKNLRSSPFIQDYSKNGPIKVSWVAVNGVLQDSQLPGVEAYLNNQYAPVLSQNSAEIPIPVKLIGQ